MGLVWMLEESDHQVGTYLYFIKIVSNLASHSF